MSRVVLALSGGVDSSVAAALLRQAGHEVIGVFIRCARAYLTGEAFFRPPEEGMSRPHHDPADDLPDDATAARLAADSLGIPLKILDLEAEFQPVVDYFVDEYAAGRTPNPCIKCNAWIKFGKLFEYAQSLGADLFATGHHAQILNPGTPTAALCRGHDPGKDQSYFLFDIDRRVLPKLVFPVGRYEKSEIRRMAAEFKLAAADKPDSQDICFVANGQNAAFVRRVLHKRNLNRDGTGDIDLSGPITTADGTVIGQHQGIEQFTIGQRKGLGIALGEPHYVIRIEADTRRVVLGTRDQLARAELNASGANWLVEPTGDTFPAEVKIRYRSRPLPAMVEIISPQSFRVRFDTPCHGIAPGQAAVCYADDMVLGGGWID